MKKIKWVCITGLAASIILSGCAKNNVQSESVAQTTQAAVSASENNVSANSASGETEADPEIGETASITLGEYKGLKLTKPSSIVTEEDMEWEIRNARQMSGSYEWKAVDRPARLYDRVNIDYVGTKDGVAFEGGTAEGYDLELGSGSFIDGFEDGLVGVSKGDKRSLDLVFPENYPSKDLAGQAVVFDVTVNEVQEQELPELDDALVKKVSDYQSVKEFMDGTRKNLEGRKKMDANNQLRVTALNEALENSKIICASADIDAAVNQIVEDMEAMIEGQGATLDVYMSMMGTDLDTYKSQLRQSVKTETKQNMVVDAIYEQEKLNIEPEYEAALLEELSIEKDSYVENYGQEAYDEMMSIFRVADYLVEHADITEE